MAFFCAGFSSEANKSQKKSQKGGSKPVPPPKANGHVTSGPTHKAPPLSTTIPHSNCVDLPHSRKMIVLREYVPQDNRGLSVKGGDSVQVIQQEGNMVLVRNEYGKEGLVPNMHLFAPYTSARTRRPSNPIRPVASGSSVHELEPRGVPMYPSHSAGRPRHHGMENGDNRINGARRSTLPANATSTLPSLAHNDFNSNGPSYEQKYSPSSSSGVATGPSSPSLQQSTSRENFAHNSSSNSSSSSSFSSAEEEQDRRRCHVHQFENGIARNAGPLSSEETLTRFEGRATSESNLSGWKVRPLPTLPPHRNQEGVYLSQQSSHIYSTIGEDTPPPIPPRNIPTTNSANDMYSNPIDAISQDGSSHHSHEWVPHNRVKTVPEMWSRDEDQQYSAVFNGPVTPSRRRPSHGEPDSDSSSSRRSSKKSSQRNRIEPFLEEEEEFEKEEDHGAHKLRSQTRISKFRKCLWGLYMVTADFEAFDENEVTIHKGEHVSVWNQDDREWYWIVKHASNHTEEGFVPSCFLREIVSSDSKQAHAMELVPQDVSHLPNGGSPMRQHPSQVPPPLEEVPRHRPPSGSQERRSASVRRRSSFGSTGGGRRARLHSDSSVRSGLQAKTPSATSIEKMDFPESPPSSPPPPYSEIDHNGHNFPRFSLSQHSEVRSGVYGPHMHRTRSHGQVTATGTHLTRPRLHTLSTMPRGGGGGGNSQEMYHQPPVAVAGGSGTLV